MWSYDGIYHLQADDAGEVISKAVISETLKQEMNLHPAKSRTTKVKQTLLLKGRKHIGLCLLFLMLNFFFLKWANPGLFLFIFVLFKHNIIEKTLGFSGIRTRIVGVEGEHADHLTTTTAQCLISFMIDHFETFERQLKVFVDNVKTLTYNLVACRVTRYGKISPLWFLFKYFGKKLFYLIHYWAKMLSFVGNFSVGIIFIAVDGQIMNK